MENLHESLETLSRFRNEPKWKPFFKRMDRLIELDPLINDEMHHNVLNSANSLEAEEKRKWLEDNKDDFMPLLDTRAELDALDKAVGAISDNSRFHSA